MPEPPIPPFEFFLDMLRTGSYLPWEVDGVPLDDWIKRYLPKSANGATPPVCDWNVKGDFQAFEAAFSHALRFRMRLVPIQWPLTFLLAASTAAIIFFMTNHSALWGIVSFVLGLLPYAILVGRTGNYWVYAYFKDLRKQMYAELLLNNDGATHPYGAEVSERPTADHGGIDFLARALPDVDPAFVKFECVCGKRLRAPSRFIGNGVVCSRCRRSLVVPPRPV